MTCEYGCVLTLVVKLAPKPTEMEESSVNKVYFKDRGELGRAPQPIACGHMDGLPEVISFRCSLSELFAF